MLSTIGSGHAGASKALKHLFEQVREISPQEFRSKLDHDLATLNGWRARIAIIGQVKAGKSTFLGALTRNPGFLPSEVNPWTSVVTNLHFGHPDDPDSGGVFHFFEEGSWERIINGDPETRQMAEDMLPGFRSEVLKMQVETMQARAKKRLGEFYRMLLGNSHSYEVVTRQTLERYVCAGDEYSTGPSGSPAGRYSDLTERADIYLPAGPFASPAVLSDTPGVNDPFMVRDEYTCRSLGQADIFIMTLSAHQALTEIDIALLKMLALRDVNEIIIFVNRLDELTDYADIAARIVEDVHARLAEAIPGRIFTIIVGSAFWAELAQSEPTSDHLVMEETGRDGVAAYFDSFTGDDRRTQMLHASGLTAVEKALSRAIDEGQGLEMRRRTAANLSASITACKTLLSEHRAKIEEKQSAIEADRDTDAMRAEIDDQIAAMGSEKQMMEAVVNHGRNEVNKAMDEGIVSLRRDLDHLLKDFAQSTCDAFFEEMQDSRDMTSFELDTIPFRSTLEQAFQTNYAGARQRLDRSLNALVSDVTANGKTMVSQLMTSDLLEDLPHNDTTPVFHTTASHLTLELVSPTGWKFWKRSKLRPEEARKKLAMLIRADFYPPIENFVLHTQERLAERAEKALTAVTSTTDAAFATLGSQITELQQDLEAEENGLGFDRSKSIDRLRRSLDDVERGMELLRNVEGEVEALISTTSPQSGLSAAAG